jgi:hypothetical protein
MQTRTAGSRTLAALELLIPFIGWCPAALVGEHARAVGARRVR